QTALMRLAFGQDDMDRLTAAYEQTMALSQTIALQPSLVHSLLGAAIQSSLLAEARCLLLEGTLPAQTLSAMLEATARYALPPSSHALRGEHMIVQDMLQHAFTDNGQGNGYLIDSSDFTGLQRIATPTFVNA